jgi:hypothetical protein
MKNLRFSKVIVIAGVAMLVLSAGFVLYIWNRQQTPAPASLAEPAGPEPRGSTSRRLRSSEAIVSGPETQELAMVDFDWHQTLTNGVMPPKLPREEVEKYLERNHRNAASLLAAYRALGDTNYLKEATHNFPNDARVQLGVLARDVFPEERRKWLDLFKASSPDNSLANYLSARDYLKSGQSGLAMSELRDAAAQPAFRDYAMESKLDDEALNMAAGRSSLQARLSSAGWAEDLQFAPLKGLAYDIAALQKQYLSGGDTSSAENLAQAGLLLASRLDTADGGKFVINQLTGHSIEAMMLGQLDPNASYDFLGGKTPKDRLAELKQERVSIRAISQNFRDALPNMTEAELLSYTDRQRMYGELEAMRWLQQCRNAASGPEKPQ